MESGTSAVHILNTFKRCQDIGSLLGYCITLRIYCYSFLGKKKYTIPSHMILATQQFEAFLRVFLLLLLFYNPRAVFTG